MLWILKCRAIIRARAGVMNAADYYGLDELKRACSGFIQCCVNVDTVCALLATAERYIQVRSGRVRLLLRAPAPQFEIDPFRSTSAPSPSCREFSSSSTSMATRYIFVIQRYK